MKLSLKIITAAGLLLLFISFLLSIQIGAKDISTSKIVQSLLDFDGSLDAKLIRDVRLPRAIASILVGGMLSLVGAMMQGVMKNVIAEPSIMGVTQGATLAVSISYTSTLFSGVFANFFLSLFGSFLSGFFIFMIAFKYKSKQDFSKVLLAGISISTFFLSIASIIALLKNRSQELAFWISGGFRQVTWVHVIFLVLFGGFFTFLSLILSNKINIISLGDETSVSLGVSPFHIKLKAVSYIIPICAVCVATAGNITFVGLFIPHIIRKIASVNYSILMPISFIYGGLVLTFSDILARTILNPYELPVGLFTALIGIPVFLLLVRKEKD